MFQDLALWPQLTVAGNLQFVLDALKVPRAERSRRIDDGLKLVQIDRFASATRTSSRAANSSGLHLRRALVGSPRLLLLDEPLSSLDAGLRAATRSELVRLQRTLAPTTVSVTHDREDAIVLADRVIEMRAGRIVAVTESRRTEERE